MKNEAVLDEGSPDLLDTGRRTLVIGDVTRWRAEGRSVASFDDVSYASLEELDPSFLDAVKPDIILSPLVADEFDVVEVAAKLEAFGFDGLYRAIASGPDLDEMVRAEVAEVAPNVNFGLLVIK